MNEYIAVDWGSTQLRAWRMRDGECIDKLKLPCGVTRLNGQRAEAVFQQQLAPWRGDPALPVVMAGMIGSDAGWQPVPYLACPLALEALNGQLYEVAEKVWIVPGLKVAQATDYDVMRGEETQLLGALATDARGVLRDARHPLQMGAGAKRRGAPVRHGDDRRTASPAA